MFTIKADSLSNGIARGTILNFVKNISVEERKNIPAETRKTETLALQEAIAASDAELKRTRAEVLQTLGNDKAEIFECHAAILEDKEFQSDMYALIDKEGYSASYAVHVIAEKNAIEMEELGDPLFSARAADFRDIGQRIISHLLHDTGEDAVFPPAPAIVAAVSLTPGETIRFCKLNLRGIVVCKGGKNSHAAILARSIGVPAVVIQETMLSLLRDGTQVVINLEPDELIVNPDPETVAIAEKQKHCQADRKLRLDRLRGKEAITPDGKKVKLYANGGSMKDLPEITAADPEGIGLFRTEFLFMEQDSLPNEEIQAAYYRRILESVKGKPVIFRLLDIGGDKPLSYKPLPFEKNPFLGCRGIRFLIDNPDILRTQIRGLLLASVSSNETVRIMVPMVSVLSEMVTVNRIIVEEMKNIGGHAIPGMMVETPAAAMNVRAFSGLSHFISIGSNDLTQYTIAVDRESERLSPLYNEFHPAVLGLMKKAVADAHESGMATGLCGEFASKPAGAALLTGLGFDELSMACAAIPAIKEIILGCSMKELQQLAGKVLLLPDAEAVNRTVTDFLDSKGLLL